MTVISIVGARPQFIKSSPVDQALREAGIDHSIVHTGQHYSPELSQVFFNQLELPEPVINLEVGSASHAVQIARILERLEEWLLSQELPDYLLIYGDTNSSLAGALVGSKLQIPIAHIEAGERCGDRTQPEEINRILIDHMSDLFFCSSDRARANLLRESVSSGVHVVGDVMLDVLQSSMKSITPEVLTRLGLRREEYYLATAHRQESTDSKERLRSIFDALAALSYPVVLPLHPRTRKVLEGFSERERRNWGSRIRLIDPVSYLDMLALESDARIILTDSGGMQKEAYWLGVPCVVLSEHTSWTELVDRGYSRLAGTSAETIQDAVREINQSSSSSVADGIYGTGVAAEGIAKVLLEIGS